MTGDERDPGDEDRDVPAQLSAALRYRDAVIAALPPVDVDAERMSDELMARNRPPRGERRRLFPRPEVLVDALQDRCAPSSGRLIGATPIDVERSRRHGGRPR